MKKLYDKHCEEISHGTKPLSQKRIDSLCKKLTTPWDVVDGVMLRQEFVFEDFIDAMVFVNDVAAVADGENHHPSIHIHFQKVTLDISTSVIGGLTENDFIIARKIELLL